MLKTSSKNSKPFFSVIIPFYNVVKYLPKTIESVLAQKCANFELVLVDDGSRDDSYAVACSYKYDPRIRVLHKENGGVSSARNYGLDHARGEYIAFLDGDDYWTDEHLSLAYAYIQKYPDCEYYTSQFRQVKEGDELVVLKEVDEESYIKSKYTEWGNHCVSSSSVIIKKTLADKTGRFKTDLSIGEDGMYFFALSLNTPWLVVSPRVTTCYLLRKGSAAYNINCHKNGLSHERLAHYYRGMIEKEKKLLRGALWSFSYQALTMHQVWGYIYTKEYTTIKDIDAFLREYAIIVPWFVRWLYWGARKMGISNPAVMAFIFKKWKKPLACYGKIRRFIRQHILRQQIMIPLKDIIS